MPKLVQLSQDAADAWDLWKRESKKANEANKKADRAKDDFVSEFGDRDKAQLPDGRVVQRIKEPKSGYTVPDKTQTRYILCVD
jgi:hypothetical protein